MQIVTIESPDHQVLLTPAQPICFPLSTQIKQAILEMEQFVIALDQQEGLAGLAAPQLGLGLRLIFVQVQASWRQFRKNVFDDLPLMPMLNPCYQPIEVDGMDVDFEACFSVPNIAAEVARYRSIEYQWQDIHGVSHQAIAKGFLSRLLQHEIDHLDGILHTRLVQENARVITIDELRAERARLKAQAMNQAASSE